MDTSKVISSTSNRLRVMAANPIKEGVKTALGKLKIPGAKIQSAADGAYEILYNQKDYWFSYMVEEKANSLIVWVQAGFEPTPTLDVSYETRIKGDLTSEFVTNAVLTAASKSKDKRKKFATDLVTFAKTIGK